MNTIIPTPIGNRRVSKLIDMERDSLAIKSEYMQTAPWAIAAILEVELLTRFVVDPCCGDGRMARAAEGRGYEVYASDLYDWGFGDVGINFVGECFGMGNLVKDNTVFMNPPFSLACDFVDRARDLGARKIICFQRSVWRESRGRRAWWEAHPPTRIYQCGDRAECWYGTIPLDKRSGNGANQPHSWYVWERGQPAGTTLGTIWNANPKKRGKKT